MKYMRTIDKVGIVSDDLRQVLINGNWYNQHLLIKKVAIRIVDTLEEACDVFIIIGNGVLTNCYGLYNNIQFQKFKEEESKSKEAFMFLEIYGAILTDKGLIYVAKFDKNTNNFKLIDDKETHYYLHHNWMWNDVIEGNTLDVLQRFFNTNKIDYYMNDTKIYKQYKKWCKTTHELLFNQHDFMRYLKDNRNMVLQEINDTREIFSQYKCGNVRELKEFISVMEKRIDYENNKIAKQKASQSNLSKYTEVGTIVDIGICKIRLLDTNYNGTGLKVWQTTEVLYPDEVVLGLPFTNKDDFPAAERLLKALDKFYNELPENIREQLVSAPIPCYIPRKRKIELINSYVFLLSTIEMCQNIQETNPEGKTLDFFIRNSAIRYGYGLHNKQWLRTTSSCDTQWFFAKENGDIDTAHILQSRGIAPAFCTK